MNVTAPCRFLFAASLAALLSCSGDSPTNAAPTPAQLQAVSGGGQSATVQSSLPAALVARVTDRKGRGVPGVAVAWSLDPAGGTLSAASTLTDSAGQARTGWTLGAGAGTYTVTAVAPGLPPVGFTATATPPPVPARVGQAGGDGQTGVVGDPLLNPLAVRVVSAEGVPVPGVVVSWTVVEGQLSSASQATDAAGISRVAWTLGTTAGTQGAEARVAGLGGSPVTFRVTAIPGAVARLSRWGDGDGQTGTAGLELAIPLVVEVKDRFGNPVSGARVAWTTPDGGQLSPSPLYSSQSSAGATWKLGPGVGRQTATAAVGDVKVDFTATADPFAPVASVSFGTAEFTMGEGRTFDLQPTLRDAQGKTLSGRTVTWSSSAPAVASVASTSPTVGLVTPLSVGRATITATSEGQSGSFVLTVVTSPKLKGFSRTPAVADVSAAAAPVEFTVSATDAGPGVADIIVFLESPSRSGFYTCRANTPASGTPADGTWKCSITIPQGAEAGTWYITQVTLNDRNRTQIGIGASKLASAGFPWTLDVKNSGPPATRPAVTGLSISPATLDVTQGAGKIDFMVSATASAGVKDVFIATQSGPNGLVCESSTLVSGTAAGGTWKCSMTVPADAAAGTYQVGMTIWDNAGNVRSFMSTDLRDAGLPSTFVVTRSSSNRGAGPGAPRPAP